MLSSKAADGSLRVVRELTIASPSTKEVAQVDLWRPLLDSVSWFEHAKLYLISGEHPDGDTLRYEAIGGFDALARMKSGEWRSLQGKMKLTWQRAKATAGQPEPDWQITGWKTEEFHWIASPKRLFVEALDTALRAQQDLAKARRSQHYEATLKYYRDGMKSLPHPYFAPISVIQKEGIAVADIDGDGFDDIYITVRLGKNMLLRNHGDGTFTEEAASFGLDLPGHNGGEGVLLTVEDPGRASERRHRMPCHFHDAAVRREVPFKNDQPPSRRNRNGQRPDDLLPRRLARLSRFFANRPTRDRELIGMQTVGV